MKAAVFGLGATGSVVARQLVNSSRVTDLVVHDRDKKKMAPWSPASSHPDIVRTLLDKANNAGHADVAVIATSAGSHVRQATQLLENGTNVVSISDSPEDVEGLLKLDETAKSKNLSVVVGAGFAPGFSCLLVRLAAQQLDQVTDIFISKHGTGGPSCARQHHRALKRVGKDWVEGEWRNGRGGSGRDLLWFPDPIGARDAYRAALPSPTLLQPQFAEANRISARVTATRRDRLTAPLPMLRRPHLDGGLGAIRVEVRGTVNHEVTTIIYGLVSRSSTAAGMVAAAAAEGAFRGSAAKGVSGLAGWAEPNRLLNELFQAGLKPSIFTGKTEQL